LRSVRTRSPGRSFFLGLYGRTEKRSHVGLPSLFCHTSSMAKQENTRRRDVVSEWAVGQPLRFPSKVKQAQPSAAAGRKTKQRKKHKRKRFGTSFISLCR